LEIDLTQSYFDVSGTTLDTLSAQLDKSRVNILSPVGLVHGSMKNSSSLSVIDIEEIQLKKDKSSRFTSY
jgi:hypothetical protein